MSRSYDVREMTNDDEDAVLRLLEASLAGGPTGRRSAATFRWKHRDNPFGSSPGWVATANGLIVGVRLLMRWEFEADGQVVRAVRMVDTATAPDWQGQGIFKRLTLTALDQLSDVDLVFNTPNSSSLPGYLKMGWVRVGDVPLHVRPVKPLRLAAAAARRQVGQAPVGAQPAPVQSSLPAAHLVLQERGHEVTRLVQQAFPGSSRLSTRRSLDYLKWRYGPGSGLDYRAVVVERSGRLAGLGLGRPRRRGPLREMTLGEVLHDPRDSSSMRAVLRGAARGSTVDHVVTVIPQAAARAVVRAGYLPVPRAGLLLTARGGNSSAARPTSMNAWDLRLGDLEVF